MSAADLISQGYGGYQGWGDAEADADFKATGGSGKKTGGGGGSSGGRSAVNIDMNAVPSIMDFTEKAYAPADEALKAYVMALRSQRQPLDVYGELETAAGLPEMKKTAGTLREQIGNLEDTIRRVEPNVSATTTNSMVTEGQRVGMVEARKKPLLENLGVLSTGLGRVSESITAATSDIGTKVTLYMKGQDQQIKPYEVQVTALQDRAARLVSGFTADAQNKLSLYLKKVEMEQAISDREADQAFELLKQENAYQNEIKKAAEQSKTDLAEYEKKKQIDKKYTASGATPNVTPYYDTGNSNYYGGAGISDLWNLG